MSTTELPEWAMKAAYAILGDVIIQHPHETQAVARALVSAHAAGRVAGLEEAAKVCRQINEAWDGDSYYDAGTDDCERAILSLAHPTPTADSTKE